MTCALRLYRNACFATPREVRVKEPRIGNEGGKGKTLGTKETKTGSEAAKRHEVLHS